MWQLMHVRQAHILMGRGCQIGNAPLARRTVAPAVALRPAKSVVMGTICMRGSASLGVLQGPMQKVWNSIRAANVLHAPVAA